MADREKVIDHLNNCVKASRRDSKWLLVSKDIIDDAISLLKEQETMLVEIDGQFGGIKYGRCPRCGKGLNEEVYPHWCGFCGQEVKWND